MLIWLIEVSLVLFPLLNLSIGCPTAVQTQNTRRSRDTLLLRQSQIWTTLPLQHTLAAK